MNKQDKNNAIRAVCWAVFFIALMNIETVSDSTFETYVVCCGLGALWAVAIYVTVLSRGNSM